MFERGMSVTVEPLNAVGNIVEFDNENDLVKVEYTDATDRFGWWYESDLKTQ